MTMITPSYLGETIEYSSLHACRSTLEDPTCPGSLSFSETKKVGERPTFPFSGPIVQGSFLAHYGRQPQELETRAESSRGTELRAPPQARKAAH